MDNNHPQTHKTFNAIITCARFGRALVISLTIGLIAMTSLTQPTLANDRVLNIEDTGKGFWHVEDHSLPIITINFAFENSGAINDPVNKEGLAQLLSNLLDEGAGERNAQDFQNALQDHAIELSFSSDRDHMTGKLKTLKRHAPLAFELLHDALTSPKFDEDAVNRMRYANIMRVKSSLSKPDWQAARLMNDVVFGDHPYAKNSGGTLSGLAAVTSQDLRDYKNKYLTRSRLKIATAGDVTADEMAPIIDQIFGDLPMGDTDYARIPQVTYPSAPVKKAFASKSPQSVVQMIWPAMSKDDPDYHAYRVMDYLLGGGGFSSFLMEEVREKQGLTYGIYSQPVFMEGADYLSIESATSPESIIPMTKAVQDILVTLKTKPVDPQILNDAKNYLVGSLPLRFSSTLSLSGTALRMQLDGRAINALDQWDNDIMAVTAADVQHVAARLFGDVNPIVTIVAGAIPPDAGFDMVTILPGVE